ncbi:hypothetical protein [uncultured Methylobacterium sp.]|jgi:hypothetical protein|uniref:hypothetical protein n=1 Tax=uncultured Methylobacterium sp. TaxID=157278 RepID=UPI00261183B8|nr:hypothetical protein [uncultured Methylobacterium sp.]
MTTPKTVLAQAIFDLVIEKAAAMPRQCISGDGICCLRDSNGNACFLGQIMSDDEVRPNGRLINGSADGLLQRGELPERYRDHVDLIELLQGVHDDLGNWTLGGSADKVEMRSEFLSIASAYGFNTRTLDQHFPAGA